MEETLNERYAVWCAENHHIVATFDEKTDAKRVADSYTTHRLTCEQCGCRDWKVEDRG